MARRPGKTDYASAFGKALDECMTARGVRQADLAGATGVSPAYINRMMTGSRVSPEWAETVAVTLGLPDAERQRLHHAAAVSWGYQLDLTKKTDDATD